MPGQIPSSNQQPPRGTSATTGYPDDTIKPEHYRMSLISAVQDKVRARFADFMDERGAEIDSLRRTNAELEQSTRTLSYLMAEAENEVVNIDDLSGELKRKCSALDEALRRRELRERADVEDAVVTPTPLYRQILQLHAEETAVQDLVFYLGEGLAHRTVRIDDFLKQIRGLSRKQFFLRATMELAREKAGLAV
jgi:ESCRT-I complex subunit TSG101